VREAARQNLNLTEAAPKRKASNKAYKKREPMDNVDSRGHLP